jgi:TPR repeat protein
VAAALHPDARAATALAERGCELGREACARAGRAYLTTDRARAERYFRRGCENNSDDACIALGRLDADVP